MSGYLLGRCISIVVLCACVATCVAPSVAEASVPDIHPETAQRYTLLRQKEHRSEQEQREYCEILFVLAERARLCGDKNFALYVEELLAIATPLRTTEPHHYARALRLHAQIALQQDQVEIALQRLHRALKWLETHSSLVQFSLPAIPARAYEASALPRLHDTLSREHTALPIALASEYGSVCLALAITLEEDNQLTANATYHILKAQRILYRLSALSWSAKPTPIHTLISIRTLSALLNMIQLEADAPISVMANTPTSSFLDSLRQFFSASLSVAEQTVIQSKQDALSPQEQEIWALAQIEFARIQCGVMMIQADSLYRTNRFVQARSMFQQALDKARADSLRSTEADATIRLLAVYLNERMFAEFFILANEFLTKDILADYRALHPGMVAEVHNLMARHYAAQGKTDLALFEARTAFDMSMRAGLWQNIVTSARVISLLNELTKQFSEALEFRKIADRYNDSLLLRTKAFTTLDEELQLSSYQQRDETTALRALYAEQELQLRQQRWMMWIAIVAAILLVSGITLLLWLYTARNRALRMAYLNAEHVESVNTQLLQINRRLQEMNQERTEFFGIVVHDLKTPLNSITLLARSLEDLGDMMSNADKLDTLHSMRVTAEHMRVSISKLLEVNNLENSMLDLKLTAVSLLPVMNSLIERLSVNAAKKVITLQTELPATLPAVHADEQALYNVLENLLSNAIKFSPHNDTVIIRVKQYTFSGMSNEDRTSLDTTTNTVLNIIPALRNAMFTSPTRQVSTEKQRSRATHMIRIEIEDHGKGISLQEQAGLFQKFSRLSTQPTGDEHSSGLGLFIVRKYMDAMHGSVQCESTPGVKTIFAIEIPIHIEISTSAQSVSGA